MQKIKEITQKQLEQIKYGSNPLKVFKEIAEVKPKARYSMGDTAARIPGAKVLDVFVNEFGGKKHFYIIGKVIEDDLVFAYTLYPTGK